MHCGGGRTDSLMRGGGGVQGAGWCPSLSLLGGVFRVGGGGGVHSQDEQQFRKENNACTWCILHTLCILQTLLVSVTGAGAAAKATSDAGGSQSIVALRWW